MAPTQRLSAFTSVPGTRRGPHSVCIALLAALTPLSTAHGQPASLTPLGDLPGGWLQSRALSVSADGQVVVGVGRSETNYRAFRWTRAEGMVDLGSIPSMAESGAMAANADGSAISGWARYQAMRWTATGGMAGLGHLPGDTDSWSTAISDDGAVVAGISLHYDDGRYKAFRWTEAEGLVKLEDHAGGLQWCEPSAMSEDGSVIVGYRSSAAGAGSFRWTLAEGLMGLGYLPGTTYRNWAHGANRDCSIIVGATWSANGTQAFRWTPAEGMVGLGDLPGGSAYMHVPGVSDDGSVIVGLSSTGIINTAFRWTPDHGMEKLWDVLLSRGIDPIADGWSQLTEATGISADGTMIAGNGVRHGNDEAFLAVIPRTCPSDYTGDTTIDILDFLDFIDDFAACDQLPSPCGTLGNPDLNADTTIDILDFLDFLDAFGSGC